VSENLVMPLQVIVHTQRTGEIHKPYCYDTGTPYISCLRAVALPGWKIFPIVFVWYPFSLKC